jgi:NAD(P)-dependent dehydrogenase (short-subunit alcohol dehydrogenase family)
MRLAGKLVVVTGASRGIGAAIAEAAAREGARVVLVSRKRAGLEEVATRIEAIRPGAAVVRPMHVGQVDALPGFFSELVAELGAPDALVNNAGTNPYLGPMMGAEWPAWDKTFEVNLKGPFALTKAFARHCFEADKPGSVLMVSSILGNAAAPMQGIYGMTKAALISLTRTLAHELGPARIRVNAIAPGVIETRLSAAMTSSPEIMRRYNTRAALGRPGIPSEVAGMAIALLGDDGSYVTGQTVYVDGGYAVG